MQLLHNTRQTRSTKHRTSVKYNTKNTKIIRITESRTFSLYRCEFVGRDSKLSFFVVALISHDCWGIFTLFTGKSVLSLSSTLKRRALSGNASRTRLKQRESSGLATYFVYSYKSKTGVPRRGNEQ